MKISVFYDGNCLVCDTEINYYRKQKNNDLINWVNISDHNFNPFQYGIENLPFKQRLYAKKDNDLYDGIDTFLLIWETLQIWSFMVKISKIKLIRKVMDIGYYFFTIIRPYLPKRHKCTDACQI
jgi:predicted DCC family thiol-disulfide oxidoreductase YuxK